MPQTSLSADHRRDATSIWIWLLALALALRLLSLPLMPLTDNTEARYAEIARLMLSLGDWISPHIRPDEVFWAKPPLSTWSQALSMTVFGVSEWAARLPALLWSLLSLGALAWMVQRELQRTQVWALLFVLMLSPLFFISAGAVMTEAALGACAMLVQAAWWRVLHDEGAAARRAGRVLALGLGLALLAKGPAAAVLALLPIGLHCLWRGHWGKVAAVLRDPWAWLIMLGLSLPWYVAAELRTPGFLQYFLLGEHVMRFLQPGWKGDRYGFAHAQPLGMIWLYTLLAALPAAALTLGRLGWLRARMGTGAVGRAYRDNGGTELARFALCMVAAPLLLFSFARNLIPTYAMTAVPGMALLASGLLPAELLARRTSQLMAALLCLLFAAAALLLLPREGERHSDLTLVRAYRAACGAADCALIYRERPPHSAYFYTGGALYQGMPGRPGAPAFEVLPAPGKGRSIEGALACNKERCLVRADAR